VLPHFETVVAGGETFGPGTLSPPRPRCPTSFRHLACEVGRRAGGCGGSRGARFPQCMGVAAPVAAAYFCSCSQWGRSGRLPRGVSQVTFPACRDRHGGDRARAERHRQLGRRPGSDAVHARVPVLNSAVLWLVSVCGIGSMFVTVTFCPGLTVTVTDPEKAELLMSIPPGEALGRAPQDHPARADTQEQARRARRGRASVLHSGCPLVGYVRIRCGLRSPATGCVGWCAVRLRERVIESR
jgi:hypothetical protein